MSILDNPILPKDDYIEAVRTSCKELQSENEKEKSVKVIPQFKNYLRHILTINILKC